MNKRSAKSTRRISAILCIVCIMLAVFAGTHMVYAKSTAKIITSSCTVEKGGVATVTFELSENPGIWGLKFKVGYNHDVLTLKSVKVGDVFSENEVTMPQSLDKEKFVFYASSDEISNISKNGTLVTLTFLTNAQAAYTDYAVSVDVIQAIDADGKDVNVSITEGKITVVECIHEKTEWKVIQEAIGDKDGVEAQVCDKCDKTIATRPIKAPDNEEAPDTSDRLTSTLFMATVMLLISAVGILLFAKSNKGRSGHNV